MKKINASGGMDSALDSDWVRLTHARKIQGLKYTGTHAGADGMSSTIVEQNSTATTIDVTPYIGCNKFFTGLIRLLQHSTIIRYLKKDYDYLMSNDSIKSWSTTRSGLFSCIDPNTVIDDEQEIITDAPKIITNSIPIVAEAKEGLQKFKFIFTISVDVVQD